MAPRKKLDSLTDPFAAEGGATTSDGDLLPPEDADPGGIVRALPPGSTPEEVAAEFEAERWAVAPPAERHEEVLIPVLVSDEEDHVDVALVEPVIVAVPDRKTWVPHAECAGTGCVGCSNGLVPPG